MAHTIFGLLWFGIAIWLFIEGDITNMLITIAISTILISTRDIKKGE